METCYCEGMGGQQVVGTQQKYNVSLELPNNQTMDDVDFTCQFYTSSRSNVTVEKKDMVRVDENNYTTVVDTSITGAGSMKCQITVDLGDRTEVIKVQTLQSVADGLR